MTLVQGYARVRRENYFIAQNPCLDFGFFIAGPVSLLPHIVCVDVQPWTLNLRAGPHFFRFS